MTAWIDELAEAFGTDPLSERETVDVLRVARDVAHRVERKGTPLAAFLLGLRVAGSVDAGTSREKALGEAIAVIDGRLPPEVPRP